MSDELPRVHPAPGFETEDLARRVLSLKVADLAAGRAGLEADPKDVPTLAKLATEWLERRKATHRSASDDKGRWNLHLKPWLGNLRPDEVDTALLRKIIEAKLAEKLSPSTARLLMRVLSTFYSDLVERGLASANPVKALPRATRRLIRPAHDPRTTPFVERLDGIRRLYLALPNPVNLAHAIGALAGLRTGEVLALRWEHVDLSTLRIHVRESVGGPLKDDESRIVPYPRRASPRPAAMARPHRGCRPGGAADARRDAQALRRAHAGQEAEAGARRREAAGPDVVPGDAAHVRVPLGAGRRHHRETTVQVTERYAHLRPDMFGAADRARVAVDLSTPTGKIIPLAAVAPPENGAFGYAVVTQTEEDQKTGT